ncbi:hypothetical protein BU15DRAFT_66447 [Melanogaster broomeanus]|nr:hypothetical protein BU15DRAFT_66447 [Melanogaster broomeanus]
MSTPPTRSPGPATNASSPPPLHEDTTPRISSPLNPSPKPLAPPLPRSPYQHSLAHMHTSSTEFPRMSTTSGPSLASQSQDYSPYGSSEGNTTEAQTSSRQRVDSEPTTRQSRHSSPGSYTAARYRTDSFPRPPLHDEASSLEGSPRTLTVESIGDGRERSREEDPGTSEVIKESERGRDVKRVGWGVKAGKEEDHDDPVRDSDSEHTDMHGKEKEKHGYLFSRSGTKSLRVAQEQREGYDWAEKVKHFSRPDVQLWYIQCPPDLLISLNSVDFLKCTPVSTIGHALSPIIQEGLITAVDALAFVPLPGLEVAARALLGVWEAC